MAVTRAEKEAELQQLEEAFRGSETAILVDYRGLNVPQVTELRRQLRGAKSKYKVVKNTIAKRALKGTSFEALEKHFEGTTGVAYTGADPPGKRSSETARAGPRGPASPFQLGGTTTSCAGSTICAAPA